MFGLSRFRLMKFRLKDKDVDKLLPGSPLNAERTSGFRRSKQ
jgi:hypothetical protein